MLGRASYAVRYYEKLRGNLMCLVVFVWACWLCWLGWRGVLVGLCELLARSKLVIKSLIGGGMNPFDLRHIIQRSH